MFIFFVKAEQITSQPWELRVSSETSVFDMIDLGQVYIKPGLPFQSLHAPMPVTMR